MSTPRYIYQEERQPNGSVIRTYMGTVVNAITARTVIVALRKDIYSETIWYMASTSEKPCGLLTEHDRATIEWVDSRVKLRSVSHPDVIIWTSDCPYSASDVIEGVEEARRVASELNIKIIN